MADDSRPTPRPSQPRFWNDPAKRALVFQAVLIAAVLAFAVYIVNNTLHNLAERGITTGFDFLSQTAGFGISLSLIEYTDAHSYGRTFVVGLLNTVLVSGLGIVLATLIGLIVGIARRSRNWLVAKVAAAYIETFRNIPLLLQILFWYFAVLNPLPGPRQSLELAAGAVLNNRGLYLPAPVLEAGFGWVLLALGVAVVGVAVLVRWAHRRQDRTGRIFPTVKVSLALLIGLPLLAFLATGLPLSWEFPELAGFNIRGGTRMITELTALLLALSIYTAAFIAEIVRGGLESVPKGQTEAAHALGLSHARTLRFVVVPQALRVIIPPLTSQYLNLTKNSSLATAIGYPDLVSVFAGTTLNQTGQAIEVISMTMAVYLTLSLLTSLFMNWYNKRIELVES